MKAYSTAFFIHGILLGIVFPILVLGGVWLGLLIFNGMVETRANLYKEELNLTSKISSATEMLQSMRPVQSLAVGLRDTNVRTLVSSVTQAYPRLSLGLNNLEQTVGFSNTPPFGALPGFALEQITVNARGRFCVLAEALGVLDQSVPGLIISSLTLSPSANNDIDAGTGVLVAQAVYGAMAPGNLTIANVTDASMSSPGAIP